MAQSDTKRIRLTRSIVLGGEHADEGEVHEVARALAQNLVGEGSAIYHVEEGEQPEVGPTAVDRMTRPSHADPKPRKIADAKPKVKEG